MFSHSKKIFLDAETFPRPNIFFFLAQELFLALRTNFLLPKKGGKKEKKRFAGKKCHYIERNVLGARNRFCDSKHSRSIFPPLVFHLWAAR